MGEFLLFIVILVVGAWWKLDDENRDRMDSQRRNKC